MTLYFKGETPWGYTVTRSSSGRVYTHGIVSEFRGLVSAASSEALAKDRLAEARRGSAADFQTIELTPITAKEYRQIRGYQTRRIRF